MNSQNPFLERSAPRRTAPAGYLSPGGCVLRTHDSPPFTGGRQRLTTHHSPQTQKARSHIAKMQQRALLDTCSYASGSSDTSVHPQSSRNPLRCQSQTGNLNRIVHKFITKWCGGTYGPAEQRAGRFLCSVLAGFAGQPLYLRNGREAATAALATAIHPGWPLCRNGLVRGGHPRLFGLAKKRRRAGHATGATGHRAGA